MALIKELFIEGFLIPVGRHLLDAESMHPQDFLHHVWFVGHNEQM
jgi:hypothetical protein